MALREEFESQGNWLFRYRSYLPLALILPLGVAMSRYEYPLGSYAAHVVMHIVSLGMAISGAAIRLLVAGYVPDGTSGRNTKQQVASNLNTTGLYSIVRHPLYLGNFLLWGSLVVFCLSGWFLAVFCLGFWVYYERIMFAEEAFLRGKFGARFDAWAAKTSAFIPRISTWVKSDRDFSWRRAVRQEYTTFFLALEAQVGLQLLENIAYDQRLVLSTAWLALAAMVLAVYLAVRFVKKKTNLLATPIG